MHDVVHVLQGAGPGLHAAISVRLVGPSPCAEHGPRTRSHLAHQPGEPATIIRNQRYRKGRPRAGGYREDIELQARQRHLASCLDVSASVSASHGPPLTNSHKQSVGQALNGASLVNSYPSRATESYTRSVIRDDVSQRSRALVTAEESGDDEDDGSRIWVSRLEEDLDMFPMD